ncbi:Nn.00g072160.m01.CDS01 [Neocucurbitaria sp. VM-36]
MLHAEFVLEGLRVDGVVGLVEDLLEDFAGVEVVQRVDFDIGVGVGVLRVVGLGVLEGELGLLVGGDGDGDDCVGFADVRDDDFVVDVVHGLELKVRLVVAGVLDAVLRVLALLRAGVLETRLEEGVVFVELRVGETVVNLTLDMLRLSVVLRFVLGDGASVELWCDEVEVVLQLVLERMELHLVDVGLLLRLEFLVEVGFGVEVNRHVEEVFMLKGPRLDLAVELDLRIDVGLTGSVDVLVEPGLLELLELFEDVRLIEVVHLLDEVLRAVETADERVDALETRIDEEVHVDGERLLEVSSALDRLLLSSVAMVGVELSKGVLEIAEDTASELWLLTSADDETLDDEELVS